MNPFEKINNLPVLEVLDKLNIPYVKNGNNYVLLKENWQKDTSFSIDINKNIITDFGKTWIHGSLFDFIWQYCFWFSYEDMRNNEIRSEVLQFCEEKWLIQLEKKNFVFKKSLTSQELLEKFEELKLNGFKQVIAQFLVKRWVDPKWIEKNQLRIWEVFANIWYYDNYFTTEFETYKDENWEWVVQEGDTPKNVGVFLFPCYDEKHNIIWCKIRRVDNKTIRWVKSIAVWKTGVIREWNIHRDMILVEWETDYIIIKIMWYDNVIWNLAWVRWAVRQIKELLFQCDNIYCLYDKDWPWLAGLESLQDNLNRLLLTIDFPIKEDSKWYRITDINDLYKSWYNKKKHWDELLKNAKKINNAMEEFAWDFIFLRKNLEYFDTKYKIFQEDTKIAKFMWISTKDLFRLVSEKKIPTFEDLCYLEGGKQWFYNLLDEKNIIKYNIKYESKIHPHIDYLIKNIAWHKKINYEWLHKAILYKLTHINDVNVPAVILYWPWGSGKWTFITLLEKMFWEENTLRNLKQRDLESAFDSYTWNKLIVEFQEIISWNTFQDKKILDRIKSLVGEKYITVNAKFRQAKTIENIAWFHFSSNHPVPIQLDSGESWNRRFTIIKTWTKLNDKIAYELNTKILKEDKYVQEYVNWLFDTYTNVPNMTNFPALDNDEKRNLELSCESSTNLFFKWVEAEFPYIIKINKKQKNILLDKYCAETGEDRYDVKFKDKNFDNGLSHRVVKKTVRLWDKTYVWYEIQKTKKELEIINSLPENTPCRIYFKLWELENLHWFTF